jgi:hypothetical protein
VARSGAQTERPSSLISASMTDGGGGGLQVNTDIESMYGSLVSWANDRTRHTVLDERPRSSTRPRVFTMLGVSWLPTLHRQVRLAVDEVRSGAHRVRPLATIPLIYRRRVMLFETSVQRISGHFRNPGKMLSRHHLSLLMAVILSVFLLSPPVKAKQIKTDKELTVAIEAEHAGDFEKALELITPVLAKKPGELSYQIAAYRIALTILQKAAEIDPASDQARQEIRLPACCPFRKSRRPTLDRSI